jgi:CheY-like chemotaxis protein
LSFVVLSFVVLSFVATANFDTGGVIMLAGSAASLRRAAPEVSSPMFRSYRQPLADTTIEGAAPRWPVPGLAASEPPRARVLLVGNQAVIALDLQRQLREAGYCMVGPATSVDEIRALMARGRIDAAVIDLDGLVGNAAEIADLLSGTDVRLVFLASSRDMLPAGHADRSVVDKPYSNQQLLAALEAAMADDQPDIVYPVTPPMSWPRVFPQL